MAETAAQTQYRDELVGAFEEGMSWLRQTTVSEAVIKGNTASFLVAGSGGASAVTRGVNGMIPARSDDLTQSSASLTEWHDLVRKTRFNIFQSQGDQRRLMQETTKKVLNRRIDADIVTQLDTATNTTGVAQTATLSLVMKALTKLGNAEIPVEEEDKMWATVTPAFMAYLEEMPEFSSADYVNVKPMAGPSRRVRRWKGVNWIKHPNLTGVGTSSEKCYLYHQDAVGSAFDSGEGLNTAIGYNDEQDYSYARASSFTGAKLLQQSGIIQMLHDGSAYA